jgi:tetratricopeptide (TPR) repeat protein
MDLGALRARVAASPDDAHAWFLLGTAALDAGALAEAEFALERAARLAPDQPAIPLAQATVWSRHGRLRDAVDLVRALLARQPGFAPAEQRLATLLLESTPDEAGAWATRVARRDPSDATAIGTALLAALRLVRAGRHAPFAWPEPPPHRGTLSFLICSVDPQRLARARASIATACDGVDWELVAIHDARSLAEGWNRALARARGDVVVFCHDDIVLLGDGFAGRLRGALDAHDVVGVAGTRRMSGPSWAWSGAPYAFGWVAHVREGKPLVGAYALEGPCIDGIESLDGVFIAGRRELADAIRFDGDTYDGFHLYDADFCRRARAAGHSLAVRCDLPLVHWSEGRFGPDWARFARRFLAQAGLKETPMAPTPGALAAVDDLSQVTAAHAWLAHWTAAA